MPLEIRELVIRTEITTDSTPHRNLKETNKLADNERQQLVQDCVNLVMKKLRRRKQR